MFQALEASAVAQLPAGDAIQLSEIIGAMSYALDITEGQPAGHCVRCCWIGMHIGQQAGLPAADQDLHGMLLDLAPDTVNLPFGDHVPVAQQDHLIGDHVNFVEDVA